MMDCDRSGIFGGSCGTEGCENTAVWIPISEGNRGSKVYRCTDCCDRIAEGRVMTDAQREKLRSACESYKVPFRETDYLVRAQDARWDAGWVEGWVGGEPGTIYLAVEPDGSSHS